MIINGVSLGTAKKEVLIHDTTRMNLKNIMLKETKHKRLRIV